MWSSDGSGRTEDGPDTVAELESLVVMLEEGELPLWYDGPLFADEDAFVAAGGSPGLAADLTAWAARPHASPEDEAARRSEADDLLRRLEREFGRRHPFRSGPAGRSATGR